MPVCCWNQVLFLISAFDYSTICCFKDLADCWLNKALVVYNLPKGPKFQKTSGNIFEIMVSVTCGGLIQFNGLVAFVFYSAR